jgi:hypothetical protein
MSYPANPINADRRVFRKYKYRARKRGRRWAISFKLFRHLISQLCFYCSAPPSNKDRACTYTGIDRVDSYKGYLVSNVLPCCGKCNGIKSNKLSFEEMVVIGRAIREFREMGRGPKPPARDTSAVPDDHRELEQELPHQKT